MKAFIETYKKSQYMGGHIVIRRIGWKVWEYMIFYNGEFYNAYIIVNPQWWRWFSKRPYSDKEVQGICQWLVNAACATTEALKKKEKDAGKPKDN